MTFFKATMISKYAFKFILLLALSYQQLHAETQDVADPCGLHLVHRAAGATSKLKTFDLGREKFTYTKIDLPGHSRVKASDLFGTEENLIFAFNRNGHAYVVARTATFHGNTHFSTNINLRSDVLAEGVIFRIEASSQEIDKYVALMSSWAHPRGLNCVSAACALVRRADQNIDMTRPAQFLPNQVVKALLRGRVYDSEGKLLQVDVYTLNGDLGWYMANYRATTIDFIPWAASAAAIFGGGTFISTMSLLHLIKSFF